jgi:hypothetical protein
VLQYEGYIKIGLEEKGFEGMDWLIWLRGQWQDLVSKTNNSVYKK